MGHTRSSKKSLIIRNKRGRAHITNCKAAKKGYYQPSRVFTQIHHIVCLSSMTNATISDLINDKGKMEFIRECLKLTTWNINAADNTVGLPLKRALYAKDPKDWDGWPCHQVEHNPFYTDEVSLQLKKRVWLNVLKRRKKCTTCGTECNIKAKSVATQLKKESNKWYRFLKRRGGLHDGTAECWRKRNTTKKTVWYIPFSMHPQKPRRRAPPADWDSLKQTLKEYLSEMFSHLPK